MADIFSTLPPQAAVHAIRAGILALAASAALRSDPDLVAVGLLEAADIFLRIRSDEGELRLLAAQIDGPGVLNDN